MTNASWVGTQTEDNMPMNPSKKGFASGKTAFVIRFSN